MTHLHASKPLAASVRWKSGRRVVDGKHCPSVIFHDILCSGKGQIKAGGSESAASAGTRSRHNLTPSYLRSQNDRRLAMVMRMARMKTVKPKDIARYLKAVRQLIKLPAQQMWTDYDEGADVLYLSFRKPQRATDSVLRDDGIIVRTRGKEIVGLTILDASTR